MKETEKVLKRIEKQIKALTKALTAMSDNLDELTRYIIDRDRQLVPIPTVTHPDSTAAVTPIVPTVTHPVSPITNQGEITTYPESSDVSWVCCKEKPEEK